MTEPLDLAPIKARLEGSRIDDSKREGDAWPYFHFFAHAPTDIAALLTEVERLEAELNKALTTHRQLLDQLETL